MSSFNCEHCHAQCTDTDYGYVTGCEHYPVKRDELERFYLNNLNRLHAAVSFLAVVSVHNKDGLAEPLLRWQADILGTMEIVSPTRRQAVRPVRERLTGNGSP
jgi:hypothetical protein